jgi:peptidoglycan hydrolase CwlO-like protein
MVSEEDLFKKPKSTRNVEVTNRQIVVEAGDKAQKESEDALKRIQQHIGTMDGQADEILVELDRQISKLDQIYDEMNDTETTLKRYPLPHAELSSTSATLEDRSTPTAASFASSSPSPSPSSSSSASPSPAKPPNK